MGPLRGDPSAPAFLRTRGHPRGLAGQRPARERARAARARAREAQALDDGRAEVAERRAGCAAATAERRAGLRHRATQLQNFITSMRATPEQLAQTAAHW